MARLSALNTHLFTKIGIFLLKKGKNLLAYYIILLIFATEQSL